MTRAKAVAVVSKPIEVSRELLQSLLDASEEIENAGNGYGRLKDVTLVYEENDTEVRCVYRNHDWVFEFSNKE